MRLAPPPPSTLRRSYPSRGALWAASGLLTLWIIGCDQGLSPEAIDARAGLEAALRTRDPMAVSTAARAASAWQGRDPALDRLLGEALANVLMKPDLGLPLLESAPAPSDPAWVEATLSAALRTGSVREMTRLMHAFPVAPVDLESPVTDQVVARALRDPAVGWSALGVAVGDCALLDQQPQRGRQPIDEPASDALLAGARALGAARVIVGRAERRTDPDPLSGRGDLSCRTGRVFAGARALPTPLPRDLVLAAEDEGGVVFLNLKEGEDGFARAFGTNDVEAAERWLAAADAWTAGGDALVIERLGLGLLQPRAEAPR